MFDPNYDPTRNNIVTVFNERFWQVSLSDLELVEG